VNNMGEPAAKLGDGEDLSQSNVVNIDKLKHVQDAVPELEDLYRKKQDAADSYASGCKRIAEKAGINHQVLKKYIKARAEGTIDDYRDRARQMDLLLEEIE